MLQINAKRQEQEAVQETFKVKEIHQRSFFAGGKEIPWAGPVFPVEAPFLFSGKKVPLGSYPDLGAEQALLAVDAADRAYDRGLGEWPQMAPESRMQALSKFADKVFEKREEIVNMLMLETAKSLPDSYKEFDRTIEYIRDTVVAYRALIEKESHDLKLGDGLTAFVDRTPLGVTLCMGPFNYPFNETMTSLIPALIMGNTAVMKPAKFGILFFEPMIAAMQECFPPGVVNVIYGDGAKVIRPIMQSGKIDVLAFIGSTKVANIVSADHPEPHRLTKILGLGAHNYSIVRADADLDKVLPEIMKGTMGFNGQRCTSLALNFVNSAISDEFAERVADQVSKLKIGYAWEKGVNITHLVEGPDKIKYLHALIDDAVSKGAKIMNQDGGKVLEHNLMVPAVLYPVTSEMDIFQKEQFGPIVAIAKYTDEDQVLRQLADSRFGQQISLFGKDKDVLGKIAIKARNLVGRVNINAQSQRGPDVLPFGGRKDSALGTLSTTDALKAFSMPSVIAVKD